MLRRRWILATAAVSVGRPAVSTARAPALRHLSTEGAVAQLASGGPVGLLAVGTQGLLQAVGAVGARAQRLADGIDPQSPLATGHGRIAARRADGALAVLQSGGVELSAPQSLAPAAGLLVLPLAVIGVQADGRHHRLVRMEPSGAARWARVARSTIDVLPDAQVVQADLAGAGDGGHLVVLAGPDGGRYPHGVLGDTVEATRLCLLERHELTPMRELVLPAPHVFEDIGPRRVSLGSRDGLLTVRSGPQGAQLVLVDADPAAPGRLRLAASGPALGTAMRWLSPVKAGHHWLAVHTPHIGGVLHEYRQTGLELTSTRLFGGVSNHALGSRRLDLSAWVDPWLLLPDQGRQRVLALDSRARWKVAHEWPLPARVDATLALNAWRGAAALLDDGRVVFAGLPD